MNQHLESPPGRRVPYEYTLSFTGPPGILPAEHHVVRPGDLATIHERFYQPVTSPGQWAFSGGFPGTNPNNPEAFFGFIEPFGPAVRLPGRLTEYAGGAGTARMRWHGFLTGPSFLLLADESTRLLRLGEQLTDSWTCPQFT